MIEECEQKEREALNHVFRANAVPSHVKQNLYEKIMREQEERRMTVKENSKQITK